jgi:hypothetical protein
MKSFLVMTILSSFQVSLVLAQNTETIRVKAGGDISKIVSPHGIYRLPSFTTGTYLKNNNITSSVKLNYNLLTGEMQYLSVKGDTMTIANPDEINFIKIQDAVFSYRNGYKAVVADHDSVKLAVQRIVK